MHLTHTIGRVTLPLILAVGAVLAPSLALAADHPTNRADNVVGTQGDDVIDSKGGRDIVHGRRGNDTLSGGANGDFLFGGPGADILNGNAGHDKLFGGAGTDTLNGGADNDFLNHSGKNVQGWGYAVFGEVIEGREIVDAIEKVATGSKAGHQDVPKDDVIIEKAEIVE